MPLREEELELVFSVMEDMISEKIETAFGRDALHESITLRKSKQDAINVICFGELIE